MARITFKFHSILWSVSAMGLSGLAHAHTGHDAANSLMAGLQHPFGLDHLLAMVAVGLWAAKALPRQQIWQAPLTFLVALYLGALVGQQGLGLRFIEPALALSVAAFGGMLLVPAAWSGRVLGLGAVALAALLHGFAHGAESPALGFSDFITGMLLTSAGLHGLGIGLGLSLQYGARIRQEWAFRAMGSVLTFAGIYAFVQV